MFIREFMSGSMSIKVHVNMGNELFIYNSFPDVDGTTFKSSLAYINIEDLERILTIAREAQKEHMSILAQARSIHGETS